ncbi:energy transducer TonB [Olleya sp. R77988]|uniref:energy transducer TonB n=1 Tax=Olleya sp. R77988 TaxID=3093875 RepID=UPI0037C6DB2B
MTFNNSHKALAITFLIIGTLMLSVLNVTVFKMNVTTTETVYEIEKVEIIKDLTESIEQKSNSKSTNKAYNKSEKQKHYAQAYKPIAPPKDYTNPKLKTYKNSIKSDKSSKISEGNSAISEETLTSFNSVNSVLSKQTKNQNTAQSNTANKNSSIYYSLKGRTDTYLPIPIYLCNAEGKIVVNVKVDNNGKVVSAYLNTSSTSTNACLQEHALEYAKEAKFNASNKKEQIGSITFKFKGK